jgi:hypothetical protein
VRARLESDYQYLQSGVFNSADTKVTVRDLGAKERSREERRDTKMRNVDSIC